MVANGATGTAATSRVGCERERRTYYSLCFMCGLFLAPDVDTLVDGYCALFHTVLCRPCVTPKIAVTHPDLIRAWLPPRVPRSAADDRSR